MKRIVFENCPYCNSKMLVYGYQSDSGNVFTDIRGSVFGSPVEHIICRECGSIVYSRVVKPEMFKDFVDEECQKSFDEEANLKPKKKKEGILEIFVDD